MLILVFWLVHINFKADRLKPYAASLAIRSSCDKQSNAFDKTVRRAPKESPLSILNPIQDRGEDKKPPPNKFSPCNYKRWS